MRSTVRKEAGGLQGISRRWAVLLGLAFITALGLAILTIQPALKPVGGEMVIGAIPLPREPTAREGYALAREVARSWQPDARPAALSVHWRQIRGRWPTQNVWTAQFYSPTTGRMALIVVEGGRARLLQETVTPYPLPTFAEERWRVDSPQALGIWWSGGGGDFLTRHTGAEVSLQLKPGPTESPVWTLTATAENQFQRVQIDGADGKVLP